MQNQEIMAENEIKIQNLREKLDYLKVMDEVKDEEEVSAIEIEKVVA